jgi:hypothetical protein
MDTIERRFFMMLSFFWGPRRTRPVVLPCHERNGKTAG